MLFCIDIMHIVDERGVDLKTLQNLYLDFRIDMNLISM